MARRLLPCTPILDVLEDAHCRRRVLDWFDHRSAIIQTLSLSFVVQQSAQNGSKPSRDFPMPYSSQKVCQPTERRVCLGGRWLSMLVATGLE